MTGLILALVAVLLSGLGARDQLTVAGLSRRQGARPALLLVGVLVCCLSAGFAGWAAALVGPLLAAPARQFVAAIALALAGGEALLMRPARHAKEPTLSLGAFAVVLLALQLTDAARFLIFGIALAAGARLPAVMGGALGGAILLAAAWGASDLITWPRLRVVRRTIGAAMLLAGLWFALEALGYV